MSLPAARSLIRALPEPNRTNIEDSNWEIPDVMAEAVTVIFELQGEIERLQEGQKTDATQLEIDYARAVRVLSSITEAVRNEADLKADTSFKCNQGSLGREFEYGTWAGRTDFANILLEILKDSSK